MKFGPYPPCQLFDGRGRMTTHCVPELEARRIQCDQPRTPSCARGKVLGRSTPIWERLALPGSLEFHTALEVLCGLQHGFLTE